MNDLPGMSIQSAFKIINAANIEEVIEQLEDRYKKDVKRSGALPKLWIPPLDEQIEKLTREWSDPKSDGSGKLWYMSIHVTI